MASQEAKVCRKCGESKPRSLFYTDASRPDGKHPWCNDCNKTRAKKYEAAHVNERRVRTYAWREKNRDRQREINRASHERNREKRNAQSRMYRETNLERMRELTRDWMKNNPDKCSTVKAMRRAAKNNAVPVWADSEFEQFAIKHTYDVAKLRTRMTGIAWHVDHIVPIRSKKVCGLHCMANMQVIPGAVNHSKGNRVWPNMPER